MKRLKWVKCKGCLETLENMDEMPFDGEFKINEEGCMHLCEPDMERIYTEIVVDCGLDLEKHFINPPVSYTMVLTNSVLETKERDNMKPKEVKRLDVLKLPIRLEF